MTHTPNVTEDGLNGLLDHATAQAASLKQLDSLCWYALEILTEADRIYSAYGPPPAPEDELRPLLEMIRHFRLIAPADGIQTPVAADSGELSAATGPHVDIAVEDDIARAVADLEGDSL